MAKSEIVAGLDMGSKKITCVLSAFDPSEDIIKIISGATIPCKGISGGVVVDIPNAANAVRAAIEEAEGKLDEEVVVDEAYVGIRGYHIESYNNKGAYNIARSDKEITTDDVASVIDNAKAIKISPDREILHVIPQGFSLDKQKGVPNPVGMEGSLLEVAVHIVISASSHLNNLMKTVSQAGFNVADPIYGLLGLGEIVIMPEEKDLGCVLIDVGGETTSIAVYYDGTLQFSKEIMIGGDYITRDIAHGLGTSVKSAREIKEKYGAVLSSLIDDNEPIVVKSIDQRMQKEIRQRDLLDFIQPRVEEILTEIDTEIKNSGFSDICRNGAVLTGGTAMLKGMDEACRQVLDLRQARLGYPNAEHIICPKEYLNQEYLTAIGLVAYPHLRDNYGDYSPLGRSSISAPSIKRWVKNLFNI